MDNIFTPTTPPYGYRPMGMTAQQNNSFVWVQGESAAKAYPVTPNNRVLLMDSENPVLYIKTADETGKPNSLQIFDLVERQQKEEIQNGSEYVLKDELEALVASTVDKVLKERRSKTHKNTSREEVTTDA